MLSARQALAPASLHLALTPSKKKLLSWAISGYQLPMHMRLLLPRQQGLGGLPEEAIEGRVLCHSISRLPEPAHPRSGPTICPQETVSCSVAVAIGGPEPGPTCEKSCRCQQDEED